MAAETHRGDRPVARSVGRSLVVGSLTALLVLMFVLTSAGPEGYAIARAATVGELNGKLEDTQVQLRKLREKIAAAEVQRKAALGDIAALDQKIDGLEKDVRLADTAWKQAEEELALLRQRLDDLSKELNLKRAELARTEAHLATQQDVFETRLANVYKAGGRVAYMAALLEPGSITQMKSRMDLLNTIVDQDNDLLTQVKTLKAEVAAQKAALEAQRVEVSGLEQQQGRVTAELEAKADEKRVALSELENARKAKQKVVTTAEKNQAAWNKQEDQLLAESERISELLKKASVGEPAAGRGVLSWPVSGSVSSGFGYRIHPIFHVRKMHTGIDISAATGVPIRASAAGVVLSAGWRGGYGKCVVVDHGSGLSTLYAHMSEIRASVGQRVDRGATIGEVGSTGYSTGPHLHFEVRVNGSPVDPIGYL